MRGGQSITLAVVAETTNNSLRFFAYRDGVLSEIGARAVPLGFAVEDVCLWRSAQDGNFYAIAVGEGGRIDQQLVFTSADGKVDARQARQFNLARSEEHTSELQSLMRTSYAVFCLKKKTNITENKL